MTVNRLQFLPLLETALKDIRNDDDFERREQIYTRFYDMQEVATKATETFFERAGIGNFEVKGEGDRITLTDPISGVELKFTGVRWSNGYAVTQEMLDHDQYAEIRKLERDLQIAGDDHLEIEGHRLLNSGFSTTDSSGFKATGFDGLALFSTAHTRLDGGDTQRNRPSTDVNLSWLALADARQQFQLWKDNRGRPIRKMPRTLIVHPADELTAREILGSTLKPGTDNNDINVLQGEMEVIVSPYLTDSNAWFVKASGTDTLWLWDKGAQPRTKSLPYDEEREIASRKRVQGFSHGHLRWQGWYASSGAS